MGNYEQLKAAITNVIKTNGTQSITGQVLQNTLLTMINSLGDNYQFVGIAATDTNPGTPDQNVFYLAGEGTYTNFSNLTIDVGQLGVLKWNGTWSKQVLEIGSGGGNMILDWNTDLATTRKQVLTKYRKPGIQISYKFENKYWINEQYIGTNTNDIEWVKDINWNIVNENFFVSKKDAIYSLNKDYLRLRAYYSFSGKSIGDEAPNDVSKYNTDNPPLGCVKIQIYKGQNITLNSKGLIPAYPPYVIADVDNIITEIADESDYSLNPKTINVESDGYLYLNCQGVSEVDNFEVFVMRGTYLDSIKDLANQALLETKKALYQLGVKEGDNYISGKYYNTDGSFSTSGTFHCYYTNPISCKEGDKFYYNGQAFGNAANYVMFNGGVKVSSETFTGSKEVVIPSGVDSIVFASLANTTEPIPFTLMFDSVLQQYLMDKIGVVPRAENYLYGKKWNVVGDSEAAGDTVSGTTKLTCYAKKLSERNNIILNNQAVGGSKIVSGGSNSLIDNYLNWIESDTDYISSHIGYNDTFDEAEPNDSTDITKFKGAYNVFIEGVLKNYPRAKFFVIIPYYFEKTDNRIKRAEWIKDRCKFYNIPFLDIVEKCGLNYSIQEQKDIWFGDQVHLYPIGHERISYIIEQFMRSL